MHKAFVLSCVIAVLAGCAAGPAYRPMVDSASVRDWNIYERDLADCQAYARRIDPAANAAAGALIGALVGAAVGASIGNSDLARHSAAFGAGAGAIEGGAQGVQSQVQIIQNCMRGRGYSVLY